MTGKSKTELKVAGKPFSGDRGVMVGADSSPAVGGG
jgi:hypothetical protein